MNHFTEDKTRPLFLLFIYGSITFGLYYLYWLNQLVRWLNTLGGSKINQGYLCGIFCMIVMLWMGSNNPLRMARLVETEQWLLMGILVIAFLTSVYFSVKLILKIHAALLTKVEREDKDWSYLSAIKAIVFNVFYFQYLINRHYKRG